MGDLSKNFSTAEFACHCGCGFAAPDPRLVVLLQAIRDHFDAPVKVLSGCRCAAHNKKVGGAKKSQHLLGFAADIAVEGISSTVLVKELEQHFYSRIGGLGAYPGFVHVDVRFVRARWSYL